MRTAEFLRPSRRPARRSLVALLTLAFTIATVLVSATTSAANTPVTGADFTTVNENVDGTGHCKNGNPNVNCNIYDGKEFVWLNGGPSVAYVGDGDYFFAVLAPGGQADPNDGAAALLSTDAYTDRSFSVSGGTVSYSGPHDFDDNKIRLMPYLDTPNPGGVYIMAICSLADGYPVNASDCKYDAFKVKEGEEQFAKDLTVTKDANGSDNNTFTWDVDKSVDKTIVKKIGGTATFTYTVHVTHDGGTISDVKVTGTISVFNPNTDAGNNTLPVDMASVTDSLSDNTSCTVTNGGAQSLTQFQTDFAYECDLSALPQGQLDNTATVTWSSQFLDDGSFLAGNSASFTFPSINFAENTIDNCTTVTDPVPSGGTSGDNPFPKTVCVGDSGDGGAGTGATDGFTFTYHVTYNVPAHDCQIHTNTATESTDGNSSSVTVTVCGPANTGALTIGFWKTTNGQNLINTYCQSGALGTYLRGLGAGAGPFSTAPTTCATLKTYVYNILNGANATNMNTMLKAQMLGTALDVWFSGPGWTSTKIGSIKPPSTFLSHNNLGTFNMDTTAICPMVDNLSTGSATCKNNTPSTDAVAAGALPTSPMAMQTILDFAATIDLSTPPWDVGAYHGANVWYYNTTTNVQDRTKQEILKNVFDQFNNNDAFGSF